MRIYVTIFSRDNLCCKSVKKIQCLSTDTIDSLKSAQLGNKGCADFRFLWISGHCFVYTFETIIWMWYFVTYYKECMK